MLAKTGVPSPKEIRKCLPTRERLSDGPVAVIECWERIPCDPCQFLCPQGAIRPFSNLNDLPQLDWERCTGCGACISGCPGLAIFVVDETFSEEGTLVLLPYEFRPLPEKGKEVWALDREGKKLCRAAVIAVQRNPNLTHVISITVPSSLAMKVRNILPPEESNER
jgi:Fe-S-cluster-containing hydrogenase component 2